MVHYFCPNCWKEIESQEVKCPHCGYDLSTYMSLTQEQKLIFALRHPIRENRMIAIQLLGDLKSPPAIAFFAPLLETEEDFYVLREIVRSLVKIGSREGKELIRKLENHPSKLVREFIGELERSGTLT
jgi:HEAT repeat protein